MQPPRGACMATAPAGPKSSLISCVSQEIGMKPAADCLDYFNIHPPQLMSAPRSQSPPISPPSLVNPRAQWSPVGRAPARGLGGTVQTRGCMAQTPLSPGSVGSLLGGSVLSHRGWTHHNPVAATLTLGTASLLSLPSLPVVLSTFPLNSQE